MKLDCWLIVESFVLPGCRHRLPEIYKLNSQKRAKEAGEIFFQQIQVVEKLIGRKLNLDSQQLTELSNFLIDNRDLYKSRLNTIRLRSKE